MERYKVSCGKMAIVFSRDENDGIETITNMSNGHKMCRFSDWKLFQAYLNLCRDFGMNVEKID